MAAPLSSLALIGIDFELELDQNDASSEGNRVGDGKTFLVLHALVHSSTS